MKMFGDSEQEKAMRSLIHGTNSTTSEIEFHLLKMGEKVKQLPDELRDIKIALHMHIEFIRTNKRYTQQHIDKYYKRFETDFA